MSFTILNLLPIASILLSLYIYLLLKKEKDTNSLIEHNQELIEKYILKNQKNITKLDKEFSEMKNSISSLKYTLRSDFKSLENKIDDLYNRWIIVADDRITSIPQNNKDWYEAKLIIAQTPQKVWKPKNLSQSKSGFVNENTKHSGNIEDEEINQDFSELSDEDFETILDDDESDDTSSSSGDTDNLQQQKPKPRKAKQKTM